MDEMNYEQFLTDLIRPLIDDKEALAIQVKEDRRHVRVHVKVSPDDLGRLIGRRGRIINSIRTLAFTCAARHNKRIDIAVDEEKGASGKDGAETPASSAPLDDEEVQQDC